MNLFSILVYMFCTACVWTAFRDPYTPHHAWGMYIQPTLITAAIVTAGFWAECNKQQWLEDEEKYKSLKEDERMFYIWDADEKLREQNFYRLMTEEERAFCLRHEKRGRKRLFWGIVAFLANLIVFGYIIYDASR